MAIPLFEMGISGKPIAILKTGSRQLQFVKINTSDFKYFAMKEGGIYELDDQYEYRYKKKVSVFFYNFSNSKPISLTGMQEVDEKLKQDGDSMLFNRDRYLNSLPPNTDFAKVEIPKDNIEELSPDTKRFLQDYQFDDEQAKTNMMLKVHHQKTPVPKYSGLLVGMGTNRGAYAIIQIGRKRIDIVPMVINNNRAYTKYGVFETSNEDIYLYKKQVVCFFVLSDDDNEPAEPIPKKANSMMKKLARDKKWKELESFHEPQPKNILKKNDDGGKDEKKPQKKLVRSISLSSEKALIQYNADSPSVFHTTLKELHASKQIVAERLSDTFKKAIPIIVIFGAVMGIAVVMSNAPPVIDKLVEVMGLEPPKIVYLTPDQAMREGIDLSNVPIRPDYDPETLQRIPKTESNPQGLYIPGDNTLGMEPSMTQSNPNDSMPELYLPDTMNLNADTRDGLIVNYVAYALDEEDGDIRADCVPKQGAWIPLGNHTIYCSVTDSGGNVVEGVWYLNIFGDNSRVSDNPNPFAMGNLIPGQNP